MEELYEILTVDNYFTKELEDLESLLQKGR